MASHMGAIGFPAKTLEELEALGVLAANLGQAYEADSGRYLYLRWEVGAGVELWAQAETTTRKLRGLQPCFASGRARLPVTVEGFVASEKRPQDGSVRVSVGEGDTPPVLVTLPDFRLVRPALSVGAPAVLSLAGFAHSLEVFPDVTALARTPGLGPGALLPAPGSPFTLVAGRVAASETRKNPSSGRDFGWLLLEAGGGTLDVLVDPELRADLPPAGAACRAVLWLSGRAAPRLEAS